MHSYHIAEVFLLKCLTQREWQSPSKPLKILIESKPLTLAIYTVKAGRTYKKCNNKNNNKISNKCTQGIKSIIKGVQNLLPTTTITQSKSHLIIGPTINKVKVHIK